MRIVGLTGSIACGKTTVSDYLKALGFFVVDGDRISRDLTAPGSPVLTEIHRKFGPDVFCEDGTLNRRRLGRLVFSDSAAREVLDNIMAPYLMSSTRSQIEKAAANGNVLCFLDMPLLFEKGYDRLCDTVWTVWLPEDIQLARLMNRDGYTHKEALQRIRSVLSSDEKASLADHVIDNSGTVDHTYSIVSEILGEELDKAKRICPRRNSGNSHNSIQQNDRTDSLPADNTPVPSVMKRPDTVLKRQLLRKSSWRMPVWLKVSLIVLACILLTGITAQLLMKAYLRQQSDLHLAEQEHIDNHYLLLYRDLIDRYAQEYNLSPAFVAAIIRNESSFNPNVESGAGARGLMQLMPDTAEWIAGKLQVDGYAFERMYDPESNIRFGCWYLNYLSRLFLGDPVSVTASYHAGQGQVKTWLSDPLLSEDGYSMRLESLPEGPTKNYTGRVLRDYGIYQEKYFSQDQSPADTDNSAACTDSLLSGNR